MSETMTVEQESIKKRDEKYNEFHKRRAVILSKFPSIKDAPGSIKNEYEALNSLIYYFSVSVNGLEPTSDGIEIDSFVKKKYESALSDYRSAHELNSDYITLEDESGFQYLEVDIDGLTEKISSIETKEDYDALKKDLNGISLARISPESARRIEELQEQLYTIERPSDTPVVSADERNSGGNGLVVSETKWQGIYERAKGKVAEVFSGIKEFVSRVFGKDTKSNNIRESDPEEKDI